MIRIIFIIVIGILPFLGFAQKIESTAKTQDTSIHPNVIQTPIAFEITNPLRDNPIVDEVGFQEFEFIMNAHRDRELNPSITPPDFSNLPKDLNVQNQTGLNSNSKALIKNFAGQNSGSYPPDCNGTVGVNYYFQVVNTTYAIFDKNTEAIVAGPSNLNSIFNSSLPGANCNSGDPIVLWDEHANKWFYAEFSLCTSNDYMLIAVSQTDDPTGSWYSWSYDVDDTPDYMKFGIWQDGYYMATNTSGGNDVYVFDRTTMIAGGASPLMIGFDNPNRPSTFDGFHCILPMDNDGDWAPSGQPGQFITIADNDQSNPADALYIYELNADWGTPTNSTFSRTQTLNVNSFAGNFTGDWNNIPQQGTTRKLDGLSTILMYRAQYRNFGGTQTLVCAHAIAEASDEAAMRWYELENTGSGWSIRQQSTYNPDNISRWNMSIAMNGSHEIGIGYSVSNASMYPGIRYTGQSATANAAANNTLDMAETTIWTGSYSQTGANRWGDYSNISIDPTDDHTFWYTNEYMASSTHGTRIVSFQFSAPSNIPIANFSADDVNPVPGQTVTFTDLSTNTPTSWAWTFSPSTITYVGATSATSQNPQVTFDAAGLYTVTLTATNADGSDDEVKVDYINVAPCDNPSNLSAVGITSTSANLTWTAGGSETLWNIEYGLQGFIQGSGTTISGVTNPYTLSGLNPSTTYDYYVQADCSAGYTSNWVGPYTFTTISCSICSSTYSNTSDDWISNVTINTINNNSGQGGADSYEDFTAISTNLSVGSSYLISVDVTVNGSWYQHTWVWIDWNQDCDFNDTGEVFDLGATPNSAGTHTLSNNITVPVNAVLGSTTMRIIEQYDQDPTPCDNHPTIYGETEDYSINVLFACTGATTTWNGTNWNNGTPDTTMPVVIAGNYNPIPYVDIEACECQINSGVILTVPSGNYLLVESNIENNGTIEIEDTGSLVQHIDTALLTGTGTYQIHKTTPVYIDYDYTYWSSPVDNETIGSVFATNPSNYIFSLNTVNFQDLYSGYGWPQTTGSSDTFDDTNDDWEHANLATVMQAGKGYIAMGEGSPFPLVLPPSGSQTQSVVFDGGNVNNGEISVPVNLDLYNTINGVGNSFHTNANLIGNPYPSAIDIINLRLSNLSILEGTFYFWTHDTAIATGGGPWAWNFTNDDYATITVDTSGNFSEVAAGNGNGTHASRYIASGQGFIANVTANGNVIFNNAMRVTGNNDNFLKSATNNIVDRVWLNLTHQNTEMFRQILIGFHDLANDGYQAGQDGQRMENGDNVDFYSIIENDERHFAIQNLATFKNDKTVQLGLEVLEAGTYTISIDQVEGIFETEQDIYIKDYLTNTLYNLSQQEGYIFTISDIELGVINQRFELCFSANTTGTSEELINRINVYPNPSQSIFNISWNRQINANLNVYDLTGKLVLTKRTKENINKYQLNLSGYSKGIYFVKIEIDGNQVVKKLVLR